MKEKTMKTMILSACACFAVALLCFGFLWWNSGTITSDPVQVVKLTTPCQYRQSPTGKLLPGTEITYQSLQTGRLYGPPWCSSDPFHPHVGDEFTLIGSTIPGYLSPLPGVLRLIRLTGVVAFGIALLLLFIWRLFQRRS